MYMYPTYMLYLSSLTVSFSDSLILYFCPISCLSHLSLYLLFSVSLFPYVCLSLFHSLFVSVSLFSVP